MGYRRLATVPPLQKRSGGSVQTLPRHWILICALVAGCGTDPFSETTPPSSGDSLVPATSTPAEATTAPAASAPPADSAPTTGSPAPTGTATPPTDTEPTAASSAPDAGTPPAAPQGPAAVLSTASYTDGTPQQTFSLDSVHQVAIAVDVPATFTGHHVMTVEVRAPGMTYSAYQSLVIQAAVGVAPAAGEMEAVATQGQFRLWTALPVSGTIIAQYGMVGTWNLKLFLDGNVQSAATQDFVLTQD